MYKYGIILYWSNDDGAFVAEAPEFPGCMAHGRTQEAALRENQRRRYGSGSRRRMSAAIWHRNRRANA